MCIRDRSGKQHTILPIFCPPNFTKFEHSTSIGKAMNTLTAGTQFWKFFRKGSFFQKTQNVNFSTSCDFSRHNSAMIIDRRKCITKWALYGISSFPFYRWNQLKRIPLATGLRTRNALQNFLRRPSDAIDKATWWTKWAWPDGVVRPRKISHSIKQRETGSPTFTNIQETHERWLWNISNMMC